MSKKLFITVDGLPIVKIPSFEGLTWLQISSRIRAMYPDAVNIDAGWNYSDGSTMVMTRIRPPSTTLAPDYFDKAIPDSVRQSERQYVEEPGDSGSRYDDYLTWKHSIGRKG